MFLWVLGLADRPTGCRDEALGKVLRKSGAKQDPGANIGADGPIFSVIFDIPEPGVTRAQVMEMILAAEDIFEEMWKTAQREMDKHGALLSHKSDT